MSLALLNLTMTSPPTATPDSMDTAAFPDRHRRKPSLTTLPTEIRLQILSEAIPTYIPIPASQCPSAPIHGPNPLLRVSRQIRAEALTFRQPTLTAVVHVDDLDAQVGRRNVEERNLFERILVLGAEGSARDVYASLRECWMEVDRVELPAGFVDDEEGGGGGGQNLQQADQARPSERAMCYSVRGACTAWSHYPWYMQAGYVE
ncbi:uncharacterized protein HMPREF1541_00184 [Cyphellophora europaea CBS 101466]|uniref:Uncharacterized protein n=1 Tax=Cyphellophora europaea (strain CBS 101466) TaxID=1220924 RepID=W2SB94_CYPE1|nr:uncharacterized protein HMPREF1541_00184 [Cyphellophora europaea CBS 101466]ETN46001.1 hypothetical protein HMPREF1541_00184 [Cyphellophora europaea CBS 101466]